MDWFLHGKDSDIKELMGDGSCVIEGTESKNYFQNEGWSYRGMTLNRGDDKTYP